MTAKFISSRTSGVTPAGAEDAIKHLLQVLDTEITQGQDSLSNPGLFNIHRTAINATSQRIEYGVIQAVIPFIGTYIVRTLHRCIPVICKSSNANHGKKGTQVISHYQPGDPVIIAIDESGFNGTILGTNLTDCVSDKEIFCDNISAASGFSFYSSPAYKIYVEKMADKDKLPVFADSCPYDTLPGDHTIITSTGMRLHIDSEMAQLSASEIVGLQLFRDSGTARLSGENLQLESYHKRTDHSNTLGQLDGYTETYIYPWETMGQQAINANVFTKSTDAQILADTHGPYDLTDQDTIPIARITELSGYVAQGTQHIVSAPQFTEANKTAQTTDLPVRDQGLSKICLGLDGTVSVESVKQLLFAKVSDIAIPRKKGKGIPADNSYSVNGTDGSHKRLSTLNTTAQSFLPHEHCAIETGFNANSVAIQHPDFAVKTAPANDAIEFNLGDGDQIQSAVKDQDVEIDNRHSTLTMTQIQSLFCMLPNGDIVLRDGYGAQLRMSKGCLYLEGTGLHIDTAKTVSIRASQISIKGNGNVELVSANRSVRIKADRDVLVLSGNSGQGGILLEDRSSGNPVLTDIPTTSRLNGINIKSSTNAVNLLGGQISIKTGPVSAGSSEESIFIDAGQQAIVMKAGNHYRYSRAGYIDTFGSNASPTGSNYYTANYTALHGSLGLSGSVIADGSIQASSHFLSLNGYFGSTQSEQNKGLVGQIRDVSPIEENMRQVHEVLESAGNSADDMRVGIRDSRETEGQFLHAETIRRVSFGFPKSSGYGTTEQKLVQPYWQQLPIKNKTLWTEPDVKYQLSSGNLATTPWPGKDTWEADSFLHANNPFHLFNPATQRIIDPASGKQTYLDRTQKDYDISYGKPSEKLSTIKLGDE